MRTGIVCGIGKLDVIPRTIIHDVVAQPVAPGLMNEETRLATECHIIRPLCIGRPPRFVTCGLISNPFQIGSYIFRYHVFRTPRLIEYKIPAGMRPVPEQYVAASVAIEPNAGRHLRKIIEGNGHVDSMPQEEMIKTGEEMHNAPKIFKETCFINWEQTANSLYDFIRGMAPYPGAWTNMTDKNGKKNVLKIFKSTKTMIPCNGKKEGTIMVFNGKFLVATKNAWLQLDEIQLSGKKRMNANMFLNGFRNIEEYTLG